ncbi:MAG TPA: peptidoglycan-associated lipoprotein Pal [Candidatus Dormibacteraeota bacterium]|nr:peptidoglycan-associated lipoprotein Pal [Candidatus Dormibacteraeota bacterium]
MESSPDSSSFRKYFLILLVSALTVFAGACAKKHVAALPPAPTPPAAAPAPPTVKLSASPDFITRGQSSKLTWTSQNATHLDLEPSVGPVQSNGSSTVTPDQSTTYTITATGPGGNAVDTVRVTVGAPSVAQPSAPSATMAELFAQDVKDAFFDYNKADIRPDAQQALTQTAEFLRSHPGVDVTVEGHCDERGSLEYNLGLGQRRANAAKQFLVSLGISADRMTTMSWGKEHPFCTEHNETCWQQNRRAHFVMAH